MNKEDLQNIRKWRQRGYWSERALVRKLQKYNYNAVRIPITNPSKLPLPDIIARREKHVYAIEVKNARAQLWGCLLKPYIWLPFAVPLHISQKSITVRK